MEPFHIVHLTELGMDAESPRAAAVGVVFGARALDVGLACFRGCEQPGDRENM